MRERITRQRPPAPGARHPTPHALKSSGSDEYLVARASMLYWELCDLSDCDIYSFVIWVRLAIDKHFFCQKAKTRANEEHYEVHYQVQ